MSTYLAIDIGGTQIRAATFNNECTEPIRHQRAKTHAPDGTIFDRLCATVEDVWPEHGGVVAIGVACPGPLDPKSGIILDTPNIPQWDNFPLVDKLKERFKVPIYLNNDASLACLGEWRFGAGKGHEDVLYLTISTGIGGGVVSENRLIQGHHGLATELGHVTVAPGGPMCGCGQRGHLEAFASGPSIVRYVKLQMAGGVQSTLKPEPSLSAKQVSEAAAAGDILAISAFSRAGKYLGIAVASFLHAFNPSIIIFGGGVSQSGPLLFEPFKKSLEKHIIHPMYLKDLEIATAELGDNAGLLGALALAQIS
ncbi:MAG: ROK family protein [Anaerolineales bacterium]|nr:ROK family protein [Anaerolineales bacterium]